MSGREWREGDLAAVECSDDEWRIAVAAENMHGLVWRFRDRTYRIVRESVARPVVVIDPACDEDVQRLCDAYRSVDHAVGTMWMRKALQSFIADPKPLEPLLLGAVVEDTNGELWIRDKTTTTVNHWKRARGEDGGQRYPYSHIRAVKILSLGVETP